MDRDDGHRYFEGLAVAHVLGGLDESEGRVFRSHLLECADCRARVGELRAIAHDLADVERDERRVRTAQAIETKRRDSDDEDEDVEELPESTRASRVTVMVGLLLLIGLSLWNFTLRGALSTQQGINQSLRQAGVIRETGQAWETTRTESPVEGSVKSKDGDFVIALDNLDTSQTYGLYVMRRDGTTAALYPFRPEEGTLYRLVDLPVDTTQIIVADPIDVDGEVGQPSDEPSGTTVFEARSPQPSG